MVGIYLRSKARLYLGAGLVVFQAVGLRVRDRRDDTGPGGGRTGRAGGWGGGGGGGHLTGDDPTLPLSTLHHPPPLLHPAGRQPGRVLHLLQPGQLLLPHLLLLPPLGPGHAGHCQDVQQGAHSFMIRLSPSENISLKSEKIFL